MKKTLIILAFSLLGAGFSQAQEAKAPNLLPKDAVVKSVAKPAFLAKFPTTIWRDNADTSWYNDADTSFELSTAAELAGLSKLVFEGNKFVGKNIKLMADVDLAAHLWDPIGYNNSNPFSGNFDGNYKTVKNLKINRPGGDWLGLFGQFLTATVKNLTLDGAEIFGNDTSGGFIGNTSTNSKAENCHVRTLDLVLTGYNGGGFTGGVLTNSEVINCSASGSVVGVNQIGGFAGTSWNNSLISKSFCEGTVAGQYIVGGFSGFVTFAFGPPTVNRIEDSYSRSNVTAEIETVGGFYGNAQTTGNFKNVYSTGTVSLVAETGGFMGKVGNLTIANAHFDFTNAPYDAIGAYMGAPVTLDITGHATAEMKTEAFKNMLNAGGTESVWSIDPAINDGYPYLNTQPLLAAGDVKNVDAGLAIAPTSVSSTFRIFAKENVVNYEISDLSGKLVQRGDVSGNLKEVNVAALQKGVYIVRLTSAQGTKAVKFIKR